MTWDYPFSKGKQNKKGLYSTCYKGRHRSTQKLVWEHHNGPVPEGFVVHLKDEDQHNIQIDNLELQPFLKHRRLHELGHWEGETFHKECLSCGKHLTVDNFYKRKAGITPWCKPCTIKREVMSKQARKARNRVSGKGELKDDYKK